MTWLAHHAEVLATLALANEKSFDGVVSDVPYGLGSHQPTPAELLAYLSGAELDTGGDFMGRDWHVPSVGTWKAIFRAMKPGAWGLTFAGPRTVDLISLGLRMAGFEIRDVITFAWWFGTGYPHAQDAAKALDIARGHVIDPIHYEPISEIAKTWDGHATALKPAFEPIILFRRPPDGTLAENIERHWIGALDIEASRVARDYGERSESWKRSGHSAKPDDAKLGVPPGNGIAIHPVGGWPANLMLNEGAAAALDADVGVRKSGHAEGLHVSDVKHSFSIGAKRSILRAGDTFGDEGGVSRYFYVTKASREERDLGCDHLPLRSAAETTGSKDGAARLSNPRTGAGRTTGGRNHAPCVKPLALTRWLAGLLLPPPRRDGAPRRLLVPYMGSGSEVIGGLLAGWDHVEGIERDAEFIPIARARIALAETNPRAFEPHAARKPLLVPETQGSLFGDRT